ncbi:DAO domain-containing protein [Fusarium falciforme]|uniref:DAO domain-containing protein n=1 Tax=Fusarium falciforme TaxID=195108 RepID=UPI00230092D2|nr:DAO domain-containing protein [Fusarium falciforme]WAO94946.1 DAO domain-containing protein [Fusarium falciforme]
MTISKSSNIAIVGGGAFGLSTALHLTEAGYTNISIYEQDDQIPPRYSAANDLNKIVRAEYEDPFWTELTIVSAIYHFPYLAKVDTHVTQQAISAWKTPFYAPFFHQTGFIHCVSRNAPEEATATLSRFRAAADAHPQLKDHVLPFREDGDIQKRFWQYTGSFPGWSGYFNSFDGYAHSGAALTAAYREAQARGVRFFLGPQGVVSEIVYEKTPDGRRATGIKTGIGGFHAADLVIVAVGAAATKLVPEIGTQVVAKSWSVAHVHLSDQEVSALRGIPITYARDLGFYFEPDPKTNLLKICPMGGGYINTDPKTGFSHAPKSLKDSAFVPEHDEVKMRKLLAETLPYLADRPLVKKSLCWFADTLNSDFIIDFVSQTSESLVLLTGDSGHGFKFFPIFGSWVKKLLEQGDQSTARWKWKDPKASQGDADWGGSVSWRLGETLELSDIQPPSAPKL